jgi:hypothetical protein
VMHRLRRVVVPAMSIVLSAGVGLDVVGGWIVWDAFSCVSTSPDVIDLPGPVSVIEPGYLAEWSGVYLLVACVFLWRLPRWIDAALARGIGGCLLALGLALVGALCVGAATGAADLPRLFYAGCESHAPAGLRWLSDTLGFLDGALFALSLAYLAVMATIAIVLASLWLVRQLNTNKGDA